MELDNFLAPLDASAPSGVELRNEPGFHTIERSIAPAAQVAQQDGKQEPVDWDKVLKDASELATSGRDLRLLVIVVRACANIDGFAGLAAGLQMMTGIVTQYWDSVFPELREKDDPKIAALRRINALKQLENDEAGLLGDLEYSPVWTARGIGPITGSDLAAASLSPYEMQQEAPSGMSAGEKDKLTLEHDALVNRVKGASRALIAEDASVAEVQIAGLNSALSALDTLEATIADEMGLAKGQAITFPELAKILKRILATLEDAMAHSGSDTKDNATPKATPKVAANGDVASKTTTPSNGALSGSVTSRADVITCLDQIIEFYERTEPSSPIPHLAKRMRRMVPMDFMALMEEIAPSGMKEFRSVAGVNESRSK